jgi:pimeloyl-ACP methyl ester carboxylesterase
MALPNPLVGSAPDQCPRRHVILIDNAGVGKSGGKVPEQHAGWAKHMLDVTLALGFKEVDVFGFSMGGFVARLIALDGQKSGLRVRRLIVAGAGRVRARTPAPARRSTFSSCMWPAQRRTTGKGFSGPFIRRVTRSSRLGKA